jgi:hypothetical protein
MVAARAWLDQEVRSLLDLGTVGLYELLELLRSSQFQLGDHDARSVSQEVARDLVTHDVASICLSRWPKDDIIDGPLQLAVLDENGVWDRLPTNLYFSLVPRHQ